MSWRSRKHDSRNINNNKLTSDILTEHIPREELIEIEMSERNVIYNMMCLFTNETFERTKIYMLEEWLTDILRLDLEWFKL